jgi:hypothetical protein
MPSRGRRPAERLKHRRIGPTAHAVSPTPENALAAICVAAAFTCAMTLSSLAYTQDLIADIPPHAHYSATEEGWTCNDEFKQELGFTLFVRHGRAFTKLKELFKTTRRWVPGVRLPALPTAIA